MISAILVSLFGVLLGAWINNIFTWKIKDKIENLDMLSMAVTKIQIFIMRSDDNKTNQFRNEFIDNIAIFRKSANVLMDFTEIDVISKDVFVKLKNYNNLSKINGNLQLQVIRNQLDNLLNDLDSRIDCTRKIIISFKYMCKELLVWIS